MLNIRTSLCFLVCLCAACGQTVEDYRAALAANPNDVAAHVNLGVLLVNAGRFDEAISEYEAADKLLPGDPRIALNTALAYQKSGRLRQAESRLETLHTAVPDNNQVTMLLADSALQLGDNRRVIEVLQPLKQKQPDELGIDYMLGMALLREGKTAESQVYLDRILKNGDSAESRFLLGTRMYEAGDYPKAVEQFANVAALNPQLPGLQSAYGAALLNTGDPDTALAAFSRELAANPADYQANLMSGQILIARRQAAEATALFKRALLARPDSGAARLGLAECLAGSKQWTDARTYAESAVKMLPGSLEAHRTLAEVYTALNLSTEARQENATAANLAKNLKQPGPAVHDVAPQFSLRNTVTNASVSLADFRGKSPVVLVFGSYSCPNFRAAAPALTSLQHRYGTSIPFLLIYIREAHSSEDWQSTRNTREYVQLAPARNLPDKQAHASMCSRKLHLNFPALVDGLDGQVEQAYQAWPSRAFVVDKNGRILYSSGLTELDFHPQELEAVLRALSSGVGKSPDLQP